MTAIARPRATSFGVRACSGRTPTPNSSRGSLWIQCRIGPDPPEEIDMKRVLLFLFALALASFASAGQSSKVDVTGKWLFNVQTDAGSGTPTVTLKQDGEKLTGHYSSATLGEAELTGTVKGQDVKFSFSADAGGQSIQVTYTGTVDGKDSMKGSVDLGGLAQGTFTAKRQ